MSTDITFEKAERYAILILKKAFGSLYRSQITKIFSPKQLFSYHCDDVEQVKSSRVK